jgi:hypothetical protein
MPARHLRCRAIAVTSAVSLAVGAARSAPHGSFRDGEVSCRQMLAAPAFSQSIANAAGASSLTGLGPYLRRIAYRSRATFAATGPAGCLGQAGS